MATNYFRWVKPDKYYSGWAPHGGGVTWPVAYTRTPHGLVLLRGMVSGTSASPSLIFVLPEDFRPPNQQYLTSLASPPFPNPAAPALLIVEIDGSVKYAGSTSSLVWLSLDGVWFPTQPVQ